jgi:triosephosphate isomerase
VIAGVSSEDGATGLFVCPAFPLIPTLAEGFGAAGGLVGAQDVSVHPPGAYTGEVSAALLAELGVRLVMVGHPERRRWHGESDDVIRAKVNAVVAAGMAPVVVVGEDREGEPAEEAVQAQVDAWLPDVPAGADVLVAYEPTWAIGQPRPAPPEHVTRATRAIRALLADRFDDPRVVYGGSAQPGTFAAIARAATAPANPESEGAEAAGAGSATEERSPTGSRPPDGVPDGVFMARFGVSPRDFLTVVDEVRGVRADGTRSAG